MYRGTNIRKEDRKRAIITDRNKRQEAVENDDQSINLLTRYPNSPSIYSKVSKRGSIITKEDCKEHL